LQPQIRHAITQTIKRLQDRNNKRIVDKSSPILKTKMCTKPIDSLIIVVVTDSIYDDTNQMNKNQTAGAKYSTRQQFTGHIRKSAARTQSAVAAVSPSSAPNRELHKEVSLSIPFSLL